jgi:hypothetical protein
MAFDKDSVSPSFIRNLRRRVQQFANGICTIHDIPLEQEWSPIGPATLTSATRQALGNPKKILLPGTRVSDHVCSMVEAQISQGNFT